MATTTRLGLQLMNTADQGKEIIANAWLTAATGNYLDNAVVLNQANPVNPVIPASSAYGSISIGSGSFAGGAVPAFQGNASGTAIAVNTLAGFGGNLLDLQVGGVSRFSVAASGLATLTGAALTALTASTEAPDLNLGLARTVQFATGALTTQRAALIQAPTYGFVGASTLTNAATLAVTGAPAAGTNATITNAMALWVQGGNSRLDGNLGVGGGSANPGSTLVVNAGTRNAPGQGILFAITCSPDTNRFAGVEYFDMAVSTGPAAIQWATGALSLQRFSWFRRNTLAFVGASTVTDTATVAIEGAPLAGTNATLTRSMALWVQAGQSRFDGDLFHKGTNVGFYNIGPVARPAAYTLAGAATRTFPTDPSSAYTGLATGLGASPYAAVADLNTLRGVVSSLEGVVRQVVADFQANGLLQ